MKRVSAAHLSDWALSRGISVMTSSEIGEILDVPASQVRERLSAPRKRGEWDSIAKGLWLPVPAELRARGALYPIDAIGPVMDKLSVNYYVGWLTAAALYGASHNAAQVFQVAIERPRASPRSSTVRISYHVRPNMSQLNIQRFPSRTAMVKVSSIETTMLDVATDISSCGGLGNAGTVVGELSELPAFDILTLVSEAKNFPAATSRRLGWMLSVLNPSLDLEPLWKVLKGMSQSPARLNPSKPPQGVLDKHWNVYLNSEFEPEE